MNGYGDLLDDDGDTPDVGADLSQLAFNAGYGRALLDAEQANSSDAAGDRILAAADKLRTRDFWDPARKEDER